MFCFALRSCLGGQSSNGKGRQSKYAYYSRRASALTNVVHGLLSLTAAAAAATAATAATAYTPTCTIKIADSVSDGIENRAPVKRTLDLTTPTTPLSSQLPTRCHRKPPGLPLCQGREGGSCCDAIRQPFATIPRIGQDYTIGSIGSIPYLHHHFR
ncbi:hypothetical protein F4782DRAFT_150065 [Xylaria castorea]|nr:hypothetical protein F4782DRAFT_150065 [Xylaria castorea]